MRTLAIIVASLALSRLAGAQPASDGDWGTTPPVPAPSAYQPAQLDTLTAAERDALDRGEITGGQEAGAVVTALLVGYGMGQVVEHRYTETGWIFTLGELGATAAITVGASELLTTSLCFNGCGGRHDDAMGRDLLIGGVVLQLGLRVGEVVDVIISPGLHNRRYRLARAKLGAPAYHVLPYVAPPSAGQGGVAGVALSF